MPGKEERYEGEESKYPYSRTWFTNVHQEMVHKILRYGMLVDQRFNCDDVGIIYLWEAERLAQISCLLSRNGHIRHPELEGSGALSNVVVLGFGA